jgi:hypothetical protein
MYALKFLGMSVVCTWGLRGNFVFTLVLFVLDDIFPFLYEGTSIHDYNQARYIERNKNCITIREWQEREGTYADSDVVETCCVDDLFEYTDNNSDEMIGDLLNDLYMICIQKTIPGTTHQ